MPAVFLNICPSIGQPPGFFDEVAKFHTALIIGGVLYLLLAAFIVWVAKERYASSQLSLKSNKAWRNLFWLFYLTWVPLLIISLLGVPVGSWWSDLHAWRDTANLYAQAASTFHCSLTSNLAAYNEAIPLATTLWVSGILLDVIVALLFLYSGLKRRKLEKSIIAA